MAESLVLRGARQAGARVSPAQASEALDASLLATGAPCFACTCTPAEAVWSAACCCTARGQ